MPSSVLHDSNGMAIRDTNPLPIQKQANFQKTIQTHNAVSVALSGSSIQASWMDCTGFDQMAITLLNDAATANSLDVQWSHDNATIHGQEKGALSSSTDKERAVNIPIKARYARVVLFNGDAALAHTMSAWAFLKA